MANPKGIASPADALDWNLANKKVKTNGEEEKNLMVKGKLQFNIKDIFCSFDLILLIKSILSKVEKNN